MEPADRPLLEVDGLSVRLGSVEALTGIDLRIGAGESLALVGPSGSGKTTLLRCLAGLQMPSRGEIRATDLGRLAGAATLRAHRRRTAMVFQDPRLIDRLAVIDNVLIGRLARRPGLVSALSWPEADRRIALAALDQVGILPLAQRRARELSGGERQRAAIARALAQEPRLLLADEPIASLDPATADGIVGLLARLHRQLGLTLVVALHQPARIPALAQSVVVMGGGRILRHGPATAVRLGALAGDRSA